MCLYFACRATTLSCFLHITAPQMCLPYWKSPKDAWALNFHSQQTVSFPQPKFAPSLDNILYNYHTIILYRGLRDSIQASKFFPTTT